MGLVRQNIYIYIYIYEEALVLALVTGDLSMALLGPTTPYAGDPVSRYSDGWAMVGEPPS